ncbi:TssN family type VI secretion system protein [Sediminicola luteus]|uniref:TssN family type VI secretion system protein n=1 Tax=Sediminicola luteus TaxID=319238 RepID=A0ABV2TYI6_9FLAO
MINNILILLSGLIILALVCLGLYLGIVNGTGKKKWKLLLYLVVTGILLALISNLGLIEFTELSIWVFIGTQAWVLLLGILHVSLFEKLIHLENTNFSRILFTLAICLFGYGLVTLSFTLFFDSPFPIFYFLPAFFFVAPTFVKIALDNFAKIPMKFYKAWEFPTPGTLADPTNSEMADPIIVNFEIRRQLADNKTIFKAKAPKGMTLGKLFYFFISDYNSKNPNSPIEITNGHNKTGMWSFYQNGKMFIGKTHLDADMTISANNIKENSSVICKRISL